jgi:hypothetical protein
MPPRRSRAPHLRYEAEEEFLVLTDDAPDA